MFKVTVKTDNAAFKDHPAGDRGEIARILLQLAMDVHNGADVYILRDANGNTVGRAGFGR